MKIFVTMPDELISERRELGGRLVPFNLEFLTENQKMKEGHKPSNWISDNDYSAACERLRSSRKTGAYATA